MSTWNALLGGVARPTLETTLRSGCPSTVRFALGAGELAEPAQEGDEGVVVERLVGEERHAVLGEQPAEHSDVLGGQRAEFHPGDAGADGIQGLVFHVVIAPCSAVR